MVLANYLAPPHRTARQPSPAANMSSFLKSYPVNCKHFIDVNIVLGDVINRVRRAAPRPAATAELGGPRRAARRHRRKRAAAQRPTLFIV